MTATDLLFLYACACVLSWGAHWMKVWERVDRERQLQERTVGWRMEISSVISPGHRRIKVENWIPSKFCTNEYLKNEIWFKYGPGGSEERRKAKLANPESGPAKST